MQVSAEFLELEKEVMTKLLHGKDDTLAILREQYIRSTVKEREFSGTGFFVSFEVPEEAQLLKQSRSFQLGDIVGQLEGVKNGVGFILFVKNGAIQLLEGYTYGDEKWPEKFTKFEVSYISGIERDMQKLREKIL